MTHAEQMQYFLDVYHDWLVVMRPAFSNAFVLGMMFQMMFLLYLRSSVRRPGSKGEDE